MNTASTISQRDAYKLMLKDYPDVMSISNALSFPEKPRARFLLKSSRTGGQMLKKCPLYGERKNKKSVGITPPMG